MTNTSSYAETGLPAAIERLSGQPLEALTQGQRDQFDQFHAGGRESVDRLLPSLQVAAGMTVLDVGSGLGGPARQIASATGCSVVGVDITAAYVQAAQALTESVGLGEQVRFVCSDVASMEPAGFDAAYTMHVQMNVADKRSLFAEIGRRLPAGGRLAVFEVCRTGAADPTPPLPWSLDGSDSHLVTPEQLGADIRSGGFDLVEWVDETEWIRGWFARMAERMAAGGGTAATLPALLDDGPVRMLNFAAAIADGVVSIHRGAFVRADG